MEQGTGELIIEWSASAGVELDDERAWRQASPHWSDGRRKTVARQLQGALRGEVADSDEPDPLQSFQAQWLNRWPERLVQPKGKTVALIAAELWADLERDLEPDETAPVWLAVEDDYGLGAAVAACARRGDGRLELDGWGCSNWDQAIEDVRRLVATGRVRGLAVGASLLDSVPTGLRPVPAPMAGADTRKGLALLRELAATGAVVHDAGCYELDQAVAAAQVREAPTGLFLVSSGPAHLVKAAVWALQGAHKPIRVPAVF